MPAAEQWITIPRWEDFQHYRDRKPTWIKTYTWLLDDPNYLGLNSRQRGLLHGLWMLYAASDGQLRASPARIARQLGLATETEARLASGGRVTGESRVSDGRVAGETPGEDVVRRRDFKRLEQAGFITLTASKPLALRYQTASLEKRREDKSLSTGPYDARARPPAAGQTKTTSRPYTCPVCTVQTTSERAMRAHLDDVHWLQDDTLEQALAGARPA